MTWRRPADGLSFQRTAKGSYEGTGGKVAHFLVAIAYGKRVILAEQYEGNMNGEKFSEFIREEFKVLFERSNNTKGKLFSQDGDPSQNSQKAKSYMDKVGARLFKFLPALRTSIQSKTSSITSSESLKIMHWSII